VIIFNSVQPIRLHDIQENVWLYNIVILSFVVIVRWILLYSPCWPQAPPASASQVLGLQAYTTMPSTNFKKKFNIYQAHLICRFITYNFDQVQSKTIINIKKKEISKANIFNFCM
jgi:hypothetical protein